MKTLLKVQLSSKHGINSDAYFSDYPSYELYLDGLRKGFFTAANKTADSEVGVERELRLIVGKDRGLKEVIKL